MIEVFHGSYVKIEKPDLAFSRETVDFGKGFYVTPLHEQAVRWALRWKRRHHSAVVNKYIYYDEKLSELNVRVKDFRAYSREWLHFVADNRNGISQEKYDIVQGGVANDKVFNTLELFFSNLIPEDEALARLKYEKPNYQICICKQNLIDSLLSFESAEEI